MKVVRTTDSSEAAANAPIFSGDVHSRGLISGEVSATVAVNLVRFKDGGRTKRHTHSQDQILYITEGAGVVASETVDNHVAAGDIVHVPAGEIHWHGSEPGGHMAHLSIMPPCETKVLE
jgi:quercetin dioxygenase-like cupin family protein